MLQKEPDTHFSTTHSCIEVPVVPVFYLHPEIPCSTRQPSKGFPTSSMRVVAATSKEVYTLLCISPPPLSRPLLLSLPLTCFGCDQLVKNLLANAGDARDEGSIHGWGRYPGEGNGNPLQCFCLENSMDRGAWWATVQRVAKSQM